MDRRSIIVLVASFTLLVGWIFLTNRLYPPKPATFSTNTLSRLGSTNSSQPVISENTNLLLNVPSVAANLKRPATTEETLMVENDEARYTFTSHGGGIKLVELKNYPETVGCGVTKPTSTTLATLNTLAPAASMTLAGFDDDVPFSLKKTATGVTVEKTLNSGIHLFKDFQLGSNYLVKVVTRLENLTNQIVKLPTQQWVIGTATPIGTNSNPALLGFYWYDGNKAEHVTETYFANRTFGCGLIPSTPRTEYNYLPGTTNIVWSAIHNQFFTLLVLPKQPAFGVRAWKVELDKTAPAMGITNLSPGHAPYGYQVAVLYPETNLPPQQTIERQFEVYAGPKEYKILSKRENNEVLVMDFGGFIGWFAQVLLFSMNKLHAWGLNYGLTIIAITVIIKTLFWPLTNASTKSMKRMATLQPQMKALQEKYKDDPKKMNTKLMEFMKENKVSPVGGCLPMLLQIPVFFGFYRMLQTAIELRGAHFLWACDLSQSDTVAIIPALGFIPFFGIPGLGLPINPLPLMMGATMLWQAHLTPPSPGVDPVQQKIMKYMPLMFMVFLYNFSAGLTLYWTVQNLLTIAQTKLTKAAAANPGTSASPAFRPGMPPKKRK